MDNEKLICFSQEFSDLCKRHSVKGDRAICKLFQKQTKIMQREEVEKEEQTVRMDDDDDDDDEPNVVGKKRLVGCSNDSSVEMFK